MFVRSLSQLVCKSRTLIRKSPRSHAFLKNPSNDPVKAAAVIEEALRERRLSNPVLDQLLTGPLRLAQLKALDMKTLTFLFHSFTELRSRDWIQWTGNSSSSVDALDEFLAQLLKEILSLDRFLQFDNRLTISRVLLGLTKMENFDSEDLKRMNYKVMSRSKRLHPETLIDVLFAWTQLNFHQQEELHIISAEALVHRSFLTAEYLTKAVWAWSQLGVEFEDHIDQFMEFIIKKIADLDLMDCLRILSSSKDLITTQRNHVLSVLDHFFKNFDIAELNTSQWISILETLEAVHWKDQTQWKMILDFLGLFRNLSKITNSDFVFLVKIYLEHELEDEEFIDRLSFEGAQAERVSTYSNKDLNFLCKAMKSLHLLNYLRIFAKELMSRVLSQKELFEMVQVWLEVPLEEEYFVDLFEKLPENERLCLSSFVLDQLHEFNYNNAASYLTTETIESHPQKTSIE